MHKNKIMSQLTCETTGWLCVNPLEMRGDVQLLEEIPGGATTGQGPSFRIFQEDQNITARFEWQCFGALANSASFGSHWHLGLHFEEMGAAPAIAAQTMEIAGPLDAALHRQDWPLNLIFPPPEEHPGTYVYRAIATICLWSGPIGDKNSKPLPVTGFADLGLFEIYCVN
jgi:hypothetical protein